MQQQYEKLIFKCSVAVNPDFLVNLRHKLLYH